MKFAQSMHAAPQLRRKQQSLLVISILFALSACGGGGGGGGGSTPPPSPPATTNQPPSVQAGPDQTIQLPTNSVTLAGSATDPEGSAITYTWTSAGSGVTFSSASSATATATFAAAGTYNLTLTASDGTLSATDTIQVTVQDAPSGPSNAAPTVNAGADQTVALGITTAQLTGTASDDNLPNNTLTYTWSSAAAGVSIASVNAATTQVTLPTASGTYEFTLTVSDGALSTADTVVVTVGPVPTTFIFPGTDVETDPDHGWKRVTPAEMGMNVTLLDQAKKYSLVNDTAGAGGVDQGGSGVIVRRGRLVYSWGNIDDRYQLKSATKSVAGIALGLAIDDQKATLDSKAQTLMPTFGVPGNDPADPRLPVISLLQLATHTAGFPKPSGFTALQAPPGTQWFYSDGSLNWLADVLTQTYAKDLNEVMKPRVWDVLKITTDDLTWRTDASGRGATHPAGVARREFASGISANTNAMARVGLLFLARGKWENTQVVSESFIDTVRTPRAETKAAANTDPDNVNAFKDNYGVLWWTNADRANSKLPEVPADAYWAWGLGDSLIVVIPSQDLVIARTGNDPDKPGIRWRTGWNGDYAVLRDFLTPIAKSVQQ